MRVAPIVPFELQPTPASFIGPASVPGDWWNQIRAFIPFWESAPGNGTSVLEDIVQRHLGTLSAGAGTVSWEQLKQGWSIVLDSTGDQINFPSTTDYGFSGDVELTVYCYCRLSSGRIGDFPGIMCNRQSGGGGVSGLWQLYIDDRDANPNQDIEFNYRASDDSLHTASWASTASHADLDDVYMSFVVTRKVGGETELWMNGISQGTQTLSTAPANANAQQLNFGILETGASNHQTRGYYMAGGIWDRALRPNEIIQLYIDPWAPVRSYAQLPVGLSEGAAVTGTTLAGSLGLMGVGI